MKTNFIKSALIIISMTVFAVASQAGNKKVLIVSDIDDTIKVSHVLSPTSKFGRALDITTPFNGMSQLYQLIINQNFNSTKVVYISNAPEKISGLEVMRISHENFLKYNNFPQGQLLLRADLADQNHKINTIRRLIKNDKPDLVIMVGDNGERDTEIYALAATELAKAGIQTQTYIHQLYSSKNWIFEVGHKLLPHQFGFVTPIEIALDLKYKLLFADSSFDWLVENVMPFIISEASGDNDLFRPMTFPEFKDCSDFKWTLKATDAVLPLVAKINKQCH